MVSKIILIGLFITFGLYIALQAVSPNLINSGSPGVSSSTPAKLNVASSTDGSSIDGQPLKPTWDAKTFDCDSPPKAAGVADPREMVALSCPVGVTGDGVALPEVRDALCKAGEAAAREGYVIRVASSFRSYESQVALWCGKEGDCFSKYPDVNERRGYCAVPGYSSHGLGRAIDVVLMKDGRALYNIDYGEQCSMDKTVIGKIAQLMYSGGFVRYEGEIWHFEVGTNLAARGRYTSYPAKCGK
ncbi:MAG: M15 family metallopeptidase [Minisyncoccia bacterium]|jgi:hypothetical protein